MPDESYDGRSHTVTQTTASSMIMSGDGGLKQQATGDAGAPPIELTWQPNDDDHPYRWSTARKWFVAVLVLMYNSNTAINATAYATARSHAVPELGTTDTMWLLGLTLYLIPISLMPLILAPLTERYGRRWTTVTAMIVYTVMFLPQALVLDIRAILPSRFFQGCAASVGNTMANAVLADMFPKEQRLVPLATSVWVVFTSQSIGSTAGVWTVYTPRLGWHWINWWVGAMALGTVILVTMLLPETRHPLLLKRKAARLTRETGIVHYVDEGPIGSTSARGVMLERMLRPVVFFFSEPIVMTLALWVGFLWGVVFLSLEGVPITMEVYGWDEPRRTSFLALFSLGATFGLAFQVIPNRQYKAARQRISGSGGVNVLAPEIRLHWSMAAAVLTCVGLFILAWTARQSVSAVVPAIGLTLFAWGVFEIYLGTLIYLADAYETYASSVVACQAVLRNILAGTFGLFTPAMYTNLTPPIATSMLAALAGVLGLAPFLIVRFGPALRKRSRVAVMLANDEGDDKHGADGNDKHTEKA